MALIDLTMAIDADTPVYPGDQKQEIVQTGTIEKDGVATKRLSISSHFSTHIDAPSHMVPGGKTLTDFPLETFIGKAIVLDVRGQREIEHELAEVQEDDIVFFWTGHTDKAGTDAFYENSPVISEATARKLVEKRVRIVGLDSYSPDEPPFPVHHILLPEDILIVENLVNLGQLAGKRFACSIFPLKIRDGDGAPCRVVAEI